MPAGPCLQRSGATEYPAFVRSRAWIVRRDLSWVLHSLGSSASAMQLGGGRAIVLLVRKKKRFGRRCQGCKQTVPLGPASGVPTNFASRCCLVYCLLPGNVLHTSQQSFSILNTVKSLLGKEGHLIALQNPHCQPMLPLSA